MKDIQRIIDALADELARPTAVDDADFRLLFYSPQRGPLDQVRIDSILHRDSPATAKDWVRAQGVEDAEGLHRLPGAPEVGLLPRAFVPVRHEGSLLGYLWIIDAQESLGAASTDRIEAAAAEIAPLLFRRRTLDLLDRQHEREAVSSLLSHDPDVRGRAAARLEDSGVLARGTLPTVTVVDVVPTGDQAVDDAQQIALEAALEQARGFVAEADIAHVSDGARGIVITGSGLRRGREQRLTAFTDRLARECRLRLPGHRVVVGVGSCRAELADARASYEEAVDTTRLLARVPALGDVRRYEDLGVYAALSRIPDESLVPDVVPGSLRRLLATGEDDLVRTLESFLDAAGDAASVADRLYVHRSTVYSRLRRIERLSGTDLDVGQDRLELHLGLALAHLVGLWPPTP